MSLAGDVELEALLKIIRGVGMLVLWIVASLVMIVAWIWP